MLVDEALRYLGAGARADEALRSRVAGIAQQLQSAIAPRWTYRVCGLTRECDALCVQHIALPGDTARTMLADCRMACVLVCTLGAQFEAMMRAAQARGMDGAVILDACGSAWVEQGCDMAQQEIAARMPGMYLTDRFSPGYGDLPLSLQHDLCAFTDAQRRLGVAVSQTHLITPQKTVTAIIGLSDRPQAARVRGCAHCSLRDTCAIFKGGKRCAL